MRFLSDVAAHIVRRPVHWMAAVVVAMVPALLFSAKLEFDSSFTALLPKKDRAVIDLNAGIARTGGSTYAVVAVGAADRPLAERYSAELERRLLELPDVRFVEAKRDLGFLRDRALLYLEDERLEKLVDDVSAEIDARTIEGAGLDLGLDDEPAATSTAVPAVDLEARIDEELRRVDISTDPYSVGKDGKYLYVYVALRGNSGELGKARLVQAAVERVAAEAKAGFPPSLEIRHSGTLVVRIEDDDFIKQDLALASALGFVGVVGLLVLYTRRIRTLVQLSIPLMAGILWTFAFANFAVGRLNIISGFLASILSGLGIEFGIHLLLRYVEARRRGEGIEEAQVTSLENTGRSLLGSGLTNAGAFFVVSFAGFQGFSEFGLIAAAGMLITLALTLIGFPAVNGALERVKPMKLARIEHAHEDALHVPKGVRAAALVVMPLLALAAFYFVAQGQPRFRTNWREIKGDSPASDFDDYIYKSLGASLTQSVVLVDDRKDVDRVVEIIDAHVARRKAAGLPSGITSHLSIHDLVPPRQAEKLPILARLEKKLDRVKPSRLDEAGRKQLARAYELARAKPFELEDVPRSLSQRMLTADGKGTLILLRTGYQFYESAELVDWAAELDQLRDSLTKAGLDTPIISENWIAGRIFQIISGDGPFILGATLIVVFLIILIDFRSLKRGALVMGALLVGQLGLVTLMALFGMELNFMNVAVLPIIVGVSIDNAVHIYHRYLEEGPTSIPMVMRHTVSATTLSSATNLMGFGAMIVAHHKGLRSVAELAVLGVLLTFVSTSVFFPLALEWWGERRRAA